MRKTITSVVIYRRRQREKNVERKKTTLIKVQGGYLLFCAVIRELHRKKKNVLEVYRISCKGAHNGATPADFRT